jgi:hypothetical protein
MAELNSHHTVVCTSYSADTEDELLSIIKSVRNVSKPVGLDNEDVYISESDVDDFNIVYSTGALEHPEGPEGQTTITSNIIDELDFHVHSSTQPEYFDQVLTTHEQMLPSASSITVTFIGTSFSVDQPLSEVIDSIDFVEMSGDGVSIDAVSFTMDDLEFTISTDDGNTIFSIINSEIESIEASKLEEQVEETVERAEDSVRDLMP